LTAVDEAQKPVQGAQRTDVMVVLPQTTEILTGNANTEWALVAPSPVMELFASQCLETRKCMTCGNHTGKFDKRVILSVMLPQTSDDVTDDTLLLTDCLGTYVKEEQMADNANLWRCGLCKGGVISKRQDVFFRIPEIAILQLVRFTLQNDSQGVRYMKNKKLVTFPLRGLDLGNLLGHGETDLFDLIGVIYHDGNTPDSGHYQACTKLANADVWYGFNDSMCTHLDEQAIGNIVRVNAYVLVYGRRQMQLLQ